MGRFVGRKPTGQEAVIGHGDDDDAAADAHKPGEQPSTRT
jgi:hypothetical protein